MRPAGRDRWAGGEAIVNDAASRIAAIEVDLSLAEGCADADWLPDEAFVARWAERAVHAVLATAPDARLRGERALAFELSVLLVDPATGRSLNLEHRGRDRATNVLSFPSGLPALEAAEGASLVVLGDLVLCAEVVRREARDQGKDERAHWAHLVVHGCLHLLGLDHEADEAARVMEDVEIRLLSSAGLPDPYDRAADEVAR